MHTCNGSTRVAAWPAASHSLVLRNGHEVIEESAGQRPSILWVRSKARDDVPAQIHRPVLNVNQAVQDSDARLRGAALTKAGGQLRRHQLHLVGKSCRTLIEYSLT